MLTTTESYIVLKLCTGEQLMGILEQETDTHIQILDPMIIRAIPDLSEQKEHITCHPYCQFTADNVFDIEKRNVIFIKPLLDSMVPNYLRIVKDYDSRLSTTETTTEEDNTIELRYFIEGNNNKH